MAKQQKNFRLESDLVTDIKYKAIELKTTESDLVARYIKEGLERDKENNS